ncbi:hypothetical protein [Phytomonospora endophytica]|uniref:Amino acid transporter n=1 Tax=Phytomonospora endophytica TaxID=714109 RepID=A0A841FQ89_9ACTN|nr:hypothetical protein [Phytomonospora endophytica]MBB6038004.1 amino acid transporter [Phytomonospora endophytica]GIG68903.1 hypothetical protein Pen01_51980 [Phytomonospora endophytica]
MRESLSETRGTGAFVPGPTSRSNVPAVFALGTAIVLSAVLAGAAIVDQASIHGLRDHSEAMYEPYGVPANPGALYGILYTVAVVGALLWIPAILGARKGKRWAAVMSVIAVVITAGLALTVFATAEYGEAVYPPVWGVLALLPALAGVLGAVPLLRRR